MGSGFRDLDAARFKCRKVWRSLSLTPQGGFRISSPHSHRSWDHAQLAFKITSFGLLVYVNPFHLCLPGFCQTRLSLRCFRGGRKVEAESTTSEGGPGQAVGEMFLGGHRFDHSSLSLKGGSKNFASVRF